MTKVNSLILKGCHVPLTAFYRPVKAVIVLDTATSWYLSSLCRKMYGKLLGQPDRTFGRVGEWAGDEVI